ncbi:conserved exported hypothetical protein [Candidatus Nitrotoga sp. BS]|nr:conserved exported hypothetical protein [Candidatus Nitrotoga sp. BS]
MSMYLKLNKCAYRYMYSSIKILIVSTVLWHSAAQAQEQVNNLANKNLVTSATDWFDRVALPYNLQIHGFASQAFISTSDNDFFGNTDGNGNFGFTEVGLNALAQPLPKLQLSVQVLSRRAGNGNSGEPRLDFGFADYRLFSRDTDQFGIRVGRLKNPFGFYNDTRDVAFTRPSILLPQSIYFDRTRNLGLSGDAVHLYGESSHKSLGSLSVQFGVFRPLVGDKDTELSLLGGDRAGNLTKKLSYIGRGIYETNNKQIRLALSGIWLDVGYDPAANDPLASGNVQFTPVFFSAQYNGERWSLTSEYAIRHFKYKNFNHPGFDSLDFTGESYYFQSAYRFTPKWEGVLRYDALFTDRADRSGQQYFAASGRPAYSRFAKDITVGLRWNVTPAFMLRTEYHNVNGTAWLSTLENPSPSDTRQHWDLFAVQASYRF